MRLDFVQRRQNALVDSKIVLDPVAVLVGFGCQRAIPGFDREGSAGHLDDGGAIKVLAEALQIDRRRGDDDLEIRPPWQQGLEVAEQEIDVEAAFVGLVDNDGVVALKETVVLGFGQQDAVGHQLDQRAVFALVLEADLITHQLTQWRADFLGYPRRNAACSQSTRLGMTDQPVNTTADFQADLRQLGGLARTRFPSNHQHLVLFQRSLDLLALGGNRQAVVVAHGRHALPTRLGLGGRGVETFKPLGEALVFERCIASFLAQVMQLTPQAMAIGVHRLVEVFQELIKGGRCVGHGQP